MWVHLRKSRAARAKRLTMPKWIAKLACVAADGKTLTDHLVVSMSWGVHVFAVLMIRTLPFLGPHLTPNSLGNPN